MSTWTLEQLLEATQGELLQEGRRSLEAIGTDTREDLRNKIFFALKGDRFDAHEFCGQAAEQGAGALVVDHDIMQVDGDVSVIKVNNTLSALQKFASYHRARWGGKLVALTGSNGKTTTKEFTATILSQKYPTLATKGNLNNHIGVPLTLLQLRPTHKFAVIEMGMNHKGEIAELAQIAKPDVTLVTNVGRAHIEHFGNVEGIAKAKEELYENAPPKATRIYNLDNTFTALMRARAPGKCSIITYSSYAKDVDVTFKEKLFTLDFIDVQGAIKNEPGTARIPSFGRQQVTNAMAAASVALACGLEPPLIWKGLEKCHSGWGRNQIIELDNGAKILFDAYNANPDSTLVAIENFSKLACRGRKFVFIGEMLELGEFAKPFHYEIGQALGKVHPEGVFLVGPNAHEIAEGLKSAGYKKNINISATYQETLAQNLGAMLQTGDVALIKGSRGMKLERVLESLGVSDPEKH